jgi:hypothetical protein
MEYSRTNHRQKENKTGMHPLITRDPVSGEELIVTRLECPKSGITIEGHFSLGWIGRLTREQLDFVELLVKQRGNIQKLAAEMDIAYNTARNRLDDIVTALGGTPEYDRHVDRRAILDKLEAKEISVEEAMKLLNFQYPQTDRRKNSNVVPLPAPPDQDSITTSIPKKSTEIFPD